MIDKYSLYARVYPMLLMLLPIFLLGVTYSIDLQNLWHVGISTLIVSSLTFLFSQLGRNLGKMKEPKLWESWGGSPSVLSLRLKSPYLNQYTKTRYHTILQMLCPVSKTPTLAGETSNPKAFDDVYETWSDYIRTHTRDVKEFHLLFKENMNYGFLRNLWGLKPIAIAIIFLAMIFNFLVFASQKGDSNILMFPKEFHISSGVLFFILVIWLSVITKRTVRIPAFAYAKRLCESVEQLNK
jgi:hypothetical protein